MKKHFFNNKNIPAKFSIFYLIMGVIGIIFLDRFLNIYFTYGQTSENSGSTLNFLFLFLIFSVLILFFILNHMQKVISRIDKSYKELKDKDKERLIPYEFALNNYVYGIYRFNYE